MPVTPSDTNYRAKTIIMLLSYYCTIFFHLWALASQHQQLVESAPTTEPRIVILPNVLNNFQVSAKNPSSKVLTCLTSGDDPGMFGQLKWSGPNRDDNSDELRKKHKVTEEPKDTNVWDLEFINPTSDDSGTYYCTGTYHNIDIRNASIKVEIVNPISLENCHVRQFLIEGQSDNRITCRITADLPRVSVFKDGKSMDQYNNRYKWNNDDALEVIGEVNQADAGVYTIKIKDQRGEKIEQNIHVEVHTKPQIIVPNKTFANNESDFYGIEGEPAQLKCTASGTPKPLVTWLDPGLRNLTTIGGYIVEPETGILNINKVNGVTDNGQFQCKAKNNVGEAVRTVSMVVYKKPIIHQFENKSVDEDATVDLECRAQGSPRPEFSIRKYGINQRPYRLGDPQVMEINLSTDGETKDLYIYRLRMSVDRSNFGLYYCNATNKAGTAERYSQLSIKYKPDLSLTPREQHIRLDKKIVYTCHIKAFPSPKIEWKIDNNQVVNVNENFTTSTDAQTHIITMSPPNQQQTMYSTITCIATNVMGTSEAIIRPKLTTRPSSVQPFLVERTPTTIKLQLAVSNDGGERVRAFKYRLEGSTLDQFTTTFSYPIKTQNETIDANPNPSHIYTIRNLYPFYSYKLNIRAVNDLGDGDANEFHFDTIQPTRPESPIIIKPSTVSSQHTTPGYPSDYNNGYLLQWGPPNLDNGDPITKYIIKYTKITNDPLDIVSDDTHTTIIEQMNERPLHAKLGPLDLNQRYRIQLQARNKYGDSDPASMVIYTTMDRPPMPEFDPQPGSLTWLKDPSTPTLIVLLVCAVVGLIIVDLIFCFLCQMGFIHLIRGWCCSSYSQSK